MWTQHSKTKTHTHTDFDPIISLAEFEEHKALQMAGRVHLAVVTLVLLVLLPRQRVVHGNAELEALMEIKASLDPQSRVLGSWAKDRDPCDGSFEGLACNEHHKVANISLQGKGLSGELSPALAELRCLSGLYLHYNSLSGTIPREIANLTELTDLYLNVNSLSGDIPSEIGNMASLQGLCVFFLFFCF